MIELRKYGVVLHNTSFTVIFSSQMGCTQSILKPDMYIAQYGKNGTLSGMLR